MRIISRSTGRKVFATVILSVGLVFVYETTIRDSRYAARQAMLSQAPGTPLPGTRLLFQATAYCKGTTTASGVNVRTGIAAADPSLLPVGSVISINTGSNSKYTGIYTIMDTGPAVKGRTLDVYMWSCHEALAFGRKQVQVTVLRLGWNPQHSTPGIVDALFRSRQVKREAPAGAEAASAADAAGAPDVAGTKGSTAPEGASGVATPAESKPPDAAAPDALLPTTGTPAAPVPAAPPVPTEATGAPATRPPTAR